MALNLNLHKIVREVKTVSLKNSTKLFLFISSYNLWFLNLYFLDKHFIDKHGLEITLLSILAITTFWCFLIFATVQKGYMVIILDNPLLFNNFKYKRHKSIIEKNVILNSFIFHFPFFYGFWHYNWTFLNQLFYQFLTIIAFYVFFEVFAHKQGKSISAMLRKKDTGATP